MTSPSRHSTHFREPGSLRAPEYVGDGVLEYICGNKSLVPSGICLYSDMLKNSKGHRNHTASKARALLTRTHSHST